MRKSQDEYGFVIFPKPGDGLKDTGEGGVEVWAIVGGESVIRDVCMTGFQVGVSEYDACVTPWFSDALRRGDTTLNAAVCIGASGMSLFDEQTGEYWQPTKADLTEGGKQLVELLETLYLPAHVLLVVLLDT